MILLSARREAGDLTPSDPSSDLLSPGCTPPRCGSPGRELRFRWRRTSAELSPRVTEEVLSRLPFIHIHPRAGPEELVFGSGSHRLHLSESDALASSSSRRSSAPDETVGTEPVAEGRRRQPRISHHPRNVFFLSRAHTHARAEAVPVPPPPRTVMQHRNP